MASSVNDILTKVLPEDVVQYEIYLLKYEDSYDDDVNKVLEEYKFKCLALAATLTCDYIWVNEGFNLCLAKSSEGNIPCLHGTTNFGEFIEDEWLIVSLMFQISAAYPELACRVKDNDGEFVLIEAADYLPKWLSPDTSNNRVFVHNGTLHIIPIPQTPGEILLLPTGQPTLKNALEVISNHPGLTQAHASVIESVKKRIEGFPAKAMEYVQRANVFIPEPIIRILDKEPNLISAAIRAFYYRDPIDLKACRVFKHFLPDTRKWCQVPMNRCSYSQLMQQNFQADRRSGYVVSRSVGTDYKGMDLGSKITHGFEILCSSCSKYQNGVKDDVFDEVSFEKYVEALRKRDYFKGEMEGSKLYKELLENAKVHFSRSNDESAENIGTLRVTAGKRILSIKNSTSSAAQLTRLSSVTQRMDLAAEDSDKWMYVDNERLEEMLSDMKNGFEKLSHKKCEVDSEQSDMLDLGEKMQSFVTNMSDYEGVEVPATIGPVNFDEDSFATALQKILGPLNDLNKTQDSDSLSDDFLPSDSESELDSEGEEITQFMDQMDRELASTNMGKSFVKSGDAESEVNGEGGSETEQQEGDLCSGGSKKEERFKPVDIDLNLVQNFLESCNSEMELPGPTTNLLQSIGLSSGTDRR